MFTNILGRQVRGAQRSIQDVLHTGEKDEQMLQLDLRNSFWLNHFCTLIYSCECCELLMSWYPPTIYGVLTEHRLLCCVVSPLFLTCTYHFK